MENSGLWFHLRLLSLHGFILVQTIFWSLASIALFLFEPTGRLAHEYGARTWSRVLLWGCRVKVTLIGSENIKLAGRAMVVVCNHQSLFDVLALLGHLPLDFKFVVKKELMKVPLWGFAMRRAGYMPIDRGNSSDAQRLFADAAMRIRNGSSVLFFAEGTRSADGKLGKFKGGGFRLACEAGCPVLPIVVQGSREVLPKGSWAIKPGNISVTVLPPLDDPELRGDSWRLMEAVRGRMGEYLGLGRD